jgi:hypothetical protein
MGHTLANEDIKLHAFQKVCGTIRTFVQENEERTSKML